MKSFVLVIAVLSISCLRMSSYAQPNSTVPDYKNPNLPVEKRVNDLVARMTLEEKVSQLVHPAKAIPRLEVPQYNWWNECLHGVARAGIATVFPQAIGLAATWNTELMLQIAEVISTEGRAKHHEFARNGQRGIYQGLTFWSPNINIFRDPRWGRGQETYGEDPYLTARMGVAFVKGLQGNDPKYLKLVATPKHYAVHSGPEPDRHHFDATTDPRDLYETYLPAFEATVKEAGAYSVMCAYNRYRGEACCGHSLLLEKILRESWGFPGYVVSDCGAIDDIYQHHQIVKTSPEAAALALKSGTDLECGQAYNSLTEAVSLGLITEADVDLAVKRLFTTRFKLGMFDPPEMVHYAQIPYEKNDCAEHRRLSVRAAQESIVLLKNEGNLLPLKKDLKKIAVIGPTADSYRMLLGNYYGKPSKFVTPLKGIEAKVSPNMQVVYEQGCNLAAEGSLERLVPTAVLSFEGKPGLQAEYFNNRDLAGTPIFTRIDPFVNSNWANTGQAPGLGESDFSIRWTGVLTPLETGEYYLAVRGDDGYRLYLNDELIIEDWTVHATRAQQKKINLEKGRAYKIKLEYFQGPGDKEISLSWTVPGDDSFHRAVDLAKESDVTIFVGGITAELEGEEMRVDYEGFRGGDRTSLELPKTQQKLLQAVHATGRPVVFVLTCGSAVAVNWENAHVPAMVAIWYPGQEGGTALADVLFGDFNPAGRLPVTFYKSVDQLPPFEDYNMKGRTYRYFEGEPLYPFGFGLSYTQFEYSDLKTPQKVKVGEQFKVSVQVENAGKMAGDEVVQLYVKDVEASVPVPLRSLQGFARIHLQPGEKQTVQFTVTTKQLSLINREMKRVVEPGDFEIAVGGVLPGFKSPTTESLAAKLSVIGEVFFIEDVKY
jgi:beta-glucosidase